MLQKKSRLMCLVLVVVMLAGLFPVSAVAAPERWGENEGGMTGETPVSNSPPAFDVPWLKDLAASILPDANAAESFTLSATVSAVLDDEGTLTVSGTGAMPDYSSSGSPFYNNTSIQKIVVEEGITRIGNNAFHTNHAQEIVLPESLATIGDYAFRYSQAIQHVVIPDGVEIIGQYAFQLSPNLETLVLGESVHTINLRAFEAAANTSKLRYVENRYPGLQTLGQSVFFNAGQTVPAANRVVKYDVQNIAFAAEIAKSWNWNFEPLSYPATANMGNNITASLAENGDLTLSGTGEMFDYNTTTNRDPFYYVRSKVKHIYIGEGITKIGVNSFRETSVENLSLPDSLTLIGSSSFHSSASLRHVIIPDGVEVIEASAFQGSSNLETLIIGSSVHTIQYQAFHTNANTSKLRYIENRYPDKQTIVTGVFYYAGDTVAAENRVVKYHIQNTTFAGTVTKARPWNLEPMSFPVKINMGNEIVATLSENGDLVVSGTGEMFNYTYSDPDPFYYIRDKIKKIQIDEGVTKIGDFSFNGTAVENLSLPESLITFGRDVFQQSSALSHLIIPDGVEIIGQAAFQACNNLETLVIGASVHTFKYKAFEMIPSSTSKLRYIENRYPGVQTLEQSVFSSAGVGVLASERAVKYHLANTSFIERLMTVNTWSADAVSYPALLNIGENVTATLHATGKVIVSGTGSIFDYSYSTSPFYHVRDKINSIQIEEGITRVGENAFFGTGAIAIALPDSLITIGDGAFRNSLGLTELVIPDNVTTIGRDAFNMAQALETLIIGKSVQAIGQEAFSMVSAPARPTNQKSYLKHIENHYPGIQTIGTYAFSYAGNNVPPSLRNAYYDFANTTFGSALPTGWNKHPLSDLHASFGDEIEHSAEGSTLTLTGSGLMLDFETGAGLFHGNVEITHLVIGEGITRIGAHAFENLPNLESVSIPSSVTEIAEGAFAGNPRLATVENSGATSQTIHAKAFQGSGSVVDGFPTALVKTTNKGFIDVLFKEGFRLYEAGNESAGYLVNLGPNLTGYLLKNSPLTLTVSGTGAMTDYASGESPLYNNTEITRIVILEGVTSIGDYAFQGLSGVTSVVIPDSVTRIGKGAFDGCTGLTELEIPASVVTIGEDAFSGVPLSVVEIPEGVETIGPNAFKGNVSLTHLVIPQSVTHIEEGAFWGAVSLQSLTIPASVEHIGADAFRDTFLLSNISNFRNGAQTIGENAFLNAGQNASNKEGNYFIANSAFPAAGLEGWTLYAFLEDLQADPSSLILKEGTMGTFGAVFTPEETNQALTYVSSDPTVASVNAAGVISALKPGSAIVTATSQFNPDFSAQVSVTVTEKVLLDLRITAPPTKLFYVEEEDFDKTGLVIMASYDNGTEKAVSGYQVLNGSSLSVGTDRVRIEYTENGVTRSVEQGISVAAKSLVSLSISKVPTKTTYVAGTDFEPAGMVVTAHYDNGKSEAITGYELVNGVSLAEGQASVTIRYSFAGTTRSVDQPVTVRARILDSIRIDAPPTKTDYIEGQNFDPAGMVVTGIFNEGLLEETLTGYTINGGTDLSDLATSVTVRYEESGTVRTATQPITVEPKVPVSIRIANPPNQTQYVEGQTFKKTGMVVEVTYNCGTVANVTEYTITPETLSLGVEEVEISYTRKGVTRTVSVPVTVAARSLVSIEVAKEPTRLSYVEGEVFDPSGMTIRARFDNGQSALVEGFTVSSEPLTLGTTMVIITYEEGGIAKTTAQNIAVYERILSHLSIQTPAQKTHYIETQTFNPAGLEVLAHYQGGLTLPTTGYTLHGTANLEDGATEVLIRYTENGVTKEIAHPITTEPKVPVSLRIETLPDKVSYIEAESFKKAGLVAMATFNTGTEELVEALSFSHGTLTLGTDSVTATYTRKGVSANAQIPVTVSARELTHLSVDAPPEKTIYVAGDSFDPAGLTVLAHYNNGASETISSYQILQGDALEAGQSAVTLSYTEGAITKTVDVDIAVHARELSHLSIDTPPANIEFLEGTAFDPTGMVVRAHYQDGSSDVVDTFTIANGNKLSLSQTSVTVSYTENGITKTVPQAITVVEKGLSHLEVTKSPARTTYVERQDFDPAGLEITAHYDNGTSRVVTGYLVSPQNLTWGDAFVTASYSEKGITKEVEIPVVVTKREPVSLRLIAPPDKTEYLEGETLVLDGLVLEVLYDNGETENTTELQATGTEPLSFGTTGATVSYIEGPHTLLAVVPIDTLRVYDFGPVTGSLSSKTRVLTLTGSGEMINFDTEGSPAFEDGDIEYLYVGEGITRIGDNSFRNAYNLKEIYLGEDVQRIGRYAFAGCTALSGIYGGEGSGSAPPVLGDVDDGAFDGTPNLDTNPGGIQVAETEITILEGETYTLQAVLLPDGTANLLVWTLTDPTIASVSGSGNILGLRPGQTTLRISAAFDETIYADVQVTVEADTLESLVILTPPAKTTYVEGEAFDPAGLVLEVRYQSGRTEPVSDPVILNGDALILGQTEVILSFGGLETAQAIEVIPAETEPEKTPVAIRIDTPPAKTAYVAGEAFDPAGMVVLVEYNTGETEAITGYTIENGSALALGQTEVTVSYEELHAEQPVSVFATEEELPDPDELTVVVTTTIVAEGVRVDVWAYPASGTTIRSIGIFQGRSRLARNFREATFSFVVKEFGEYMVEVDDSTLHTVKVPVSIAPYTFDFTLDDSTLSEGFVTIQARVEGDFSHLSYEGQESSEGALSIEVTENGTYTFRVTRNGEEKLFPVVVDQFDPEDTSPRIHTSLYGTGNGTMLQVDVTAQDGTEIRMIEIYKGTVRLARTLLQESMTHLLTGPGEYEVRATNNRLETTSVLVTVEAPGFRFSTDLQHKGAYADLSVATESLREGVQIESVSVKGPETDAVFQGEAEISLRLEENGIYTIAVTDSEGNTQSKTVEVKDLAPEQTVLFLEADTSEAAQGTVRITATVTGSFDVLRFGDTTTEENTLTVEVPKDGEYTFAVEVGGETIEKTILVDAFSKLPTNAQVEALVSGQEIQITATPQFGTSIRSIAIYKEEAMINRVLFRTTHKYTAKEAGEYIVVVTNSKLEETRVTVTVE